MQKRGTKNKGVIKKQQIKYIIRIVSWIRSGFNQVWLYWRLKFKAHQRRTQQTRQKLEVNDNAQKQIT